MGWALGSLSTHTIPQLFEVPCCVEGAAVAAPAGLAVVLWQRWEEQGHQSKHKLPVNQCHQQL